MEVKPIYKKTDLGVIPQDWDVVPMGQVGECLIGLTYSPRDVRDFGTLVLRSSNVQDGRLAFNDNVFVDMKVPDRAITRKNDILICVRNGSRQLIGKCALIDDKTAGSAFGAFMSVLRSDSAKFLFFQFQSNIQKRQIDEVMGATINQITNKDMAAFKVIWPPTKAEQEAIAKALSDADALIESLEQIIAKKRHLKQGAMQELLTGKKRLPGFEIKPGYKDTEVGMIPEDWQIKSVEQISTVGRGRVISHKEIARSRNPQYPVYSSQTSNGGVMGYLDTFEFEGEYITWTTDGANAGTVFSRNGRFNCTNVCGTIKLKSDNHLFVSKVLGKIAPRHVSRQLGNPKLMNDVMKRIQIPLPPTPAEQTAIATILSDMDAEIATLDAKLSKARQLKQGMMQELLTGRIRLV